MEVRLPAAADRAGIGPVVKLSIVLSTHAAQFQAVALKGDFAASVAKVAAWGYDGVEVAIRDPALVDPEEFARSSDDLRAHLMAERAGQFLRSILNERRRDTVVAVDEELLQRFTPTRS